MMRPVSVFLEQTLKRNSSEVRPPWWTAHADGGTGGRKLGNTFLSASIQLTCPEELSANGRTH